MGYRLLYIIALCSLFFVPVMGQSKDTNIQLKLDEAKARLEDFNTEHSIDTIDQEKLPRTVSGGVFAGPNMSNFIITRNHQPMSSYMRVGAELGGFMDFAVTKHFVVQPQVIFTAHQNYFAATDTTNRLWSFGAEIPIYFLGRYGSLDRGYIQFGGGLFTHFTFASNVANKYKNVDESDAASATATTTAMPRHEQAEDQYDYSKLYSLHNNHFGVCLLVGYECYFGMFINASYKVSFSDIAGFYKEMKGSEVANALIYPQSVSLNVGYRFR